MDMWITANLPVTHKSTASVTGTGLVIIHEFHFVLFAADDIGMWPDLVDARGDYSLAYEALWKK